MAFPDGFLQELKARNDITDVISPYVSLRRRGRNMVGLCPFHGEKTPSFNVYTEDNHFYCFGCGSGGDVITFIMKIENLDYMDAVRFLAQRAGMEMPENSYDDSMAKLRKRIYEANREAARFYYKTLYLPVGREGLDYLHGRALSDRTIRRFGLGFADDDWSSLTKHLKSLGFTEHELVAANLAVQRRNGGGVYDRFTNRVSLRRKDNDRPKAEIPQHLRHARVQKERKPFFAEQRQKRGNAHAIALRGLYGRHFCQSGGLCERCRDARHRADSGAGDAYQALRRRGRDLL